MSTTSHILTRSIATALVAGAALAPTAAAQQDLRSPDTRDAARGRSARRTSACPTPRTPRQAATAPVVEFVEVPQAEGFDVGDAIVGAGSGLGIVLIATGGALTTARMRRRRLHSAQA